MRLPLPLRRILDPRPQDASLCNPFACAVNIPADELAGRVYELPIKGTELEIVGNDRWAIEASAQLRLLGYPYRHVDGQFGDREPGRLWSPNGFVESVLPSLQPGRALDLGCGVGRDAVFMTALGWRVTAIDHLPDAIERARLLESRYRLSSDAPITWIQAKFTSLAFEADMFDLIVSCFAFDAGELGRAAAALMPGGRILVETFSPEHRQRFGKPPARRTASVDELLALFGSRLEFGDEQMRNGRHTTRALLSRT